MTQEAALIGLGATGSRAIDELTLYLPQAYGSGVFEKVACLSIDVNSGTSGNSRYIIPLKDWLDDPASLKGWFDYHYFSGEDRAHRHDLLRERQLTRALFLKHLNENASVLDSWLQSHFRKVVRTGRSITVHLLVSLEDEVSGFIPDLANFIYRAFQGLNVEPRLVLHLALPGEQADEMVMAGMFATIREIERLMVQFGNTPPRLYNVGSALERYNPGSRQFIYMLKVYPSLENINPSALWVDVLLPQLDSLEYGFGSTYLQSNVINWFSWRDDQLRLHKDRYTLITGTYFAYSAIFPSALLRQRWTARLAEQGINLLLGHELSSTQQHELLSSRWINAVQYTADKQSVTCPRVVGWLLEQPTLAQLDHVDIEGRMFANEQSIAYLSEIYNEFRRVFEWKPGTSNVTYDSPGQLTQGVEQLITDYVGGLASSGKGMKTSTYRQTLKRFADVQYERFCKSLLMFVRGMLIDSGVRNVYLMLRDLVYKPLDAVCQEFERTFQNQLRQLKQNNPLDNLHIAGRNVTKLRTMLGKPSQEVVHFLKQGDEVTATFKTYQSREALAELIQRMRDFTGVMLQNFERWKSTLWDNSDSLASITMKALTLIPVPVQSQQRLWLYEEQWANQIYTRIANNHLQSLRQGFMWDVDDNGTVSLSFSGANGKRRFSDSPHEAERKQNYRDWSATVAAAVQSERLELLDDFLLSSDRYVTLVEQICDLFNKPVPITTRTTDAIKQENLIFPSVIRQYRSTMVDTITDAVISTHGYSLNVNSSVDNTRLVQYCAVEAFPITALPDYERARIGYLRLNPDQRARLHVFTAEVEAVRWETEARTMHQIDIMFSGGIVGLMAEVERIQQYVWLSALNLARIEQYDTHRNRYALIASGEIFWLADDDDALTALTTFVFADEGVPTGKPERVRKPLPRSSLNSTIQSTSLRHVQQREQFPNELFWKYAQLLQENRARAEWALITAEQAQAALDYHHFCLKQLHELPSHATRDERGMWTVLALVSNTLYQEKLGALRNRV